jgi:CheY-like chemotaxis protein
MHIFQDLMRHRIHDVVLVSSLYDSFILAEDGQLAESVLGEALELHNPPRLTHVSSGADALAVVHEHPFNNLIIASRHLADMDILTLARRVKATGVDAPVVLLGYDFRELRDFVARADTSALEGVFLWQGDVRILLAIVRAIEDQRTSHDVGVCDAGDHRHQDNIATARRSPIVCRSSTRRVSWFRRVNLAHKLIGCRRGQNRALSNVRRGVDVFHGVSGKRARRHLGHRIPERWTRRAGSGRGFASVYGIAARCAGHASRPSAQRALARAAGAEFTLKGSPTLLHELRRFMIEQLGFGDFVFRTPGGTAIGRARDLKELEEKLRDVPPESLQHHAERNHFSKWLKARTEFALALDLRPRTVSDFGGVENLRRALMRAIHEYRRERRRATIADFDRASLDPAGGSRDWRRVDRWQGARPGVCELPARLSPGGPPF